MNSVALADGLLSDLQGAGRRLIFIGGMGFEDRALAFLERVSACQVAGTVVGVRYLHPGATNREREFIGIVRRSKTLSFCSLGYSQDSASRFEIDLERLLRRLGVCDEDQIVLDVSGLTKFLILVILLKLWTRGLAVRLVLTAANHYSPTREEFDRTMRLEGNNVRVIAGQPSSGAAAILRSTCMVSPRMQGQPVCAVAFTSFNEELIRHAIGTISPHRLVMINGMPPADKNSWRAFATQAIHGKLIAENATDNPVSELSGLLERTVSTLDFRDALSVLEDLHSEIGLYERMIYFATGSKMQTVALAVLKLRNSDVHIEYPTPASYFFKEYSSGSGSSYLFSLDPRELCR